MSTRNTEPAIVHLPDHAFAELCLERYRLNRGVYNMIDLWLHRQGWRDIRERRAIILEFLESCAGESPPEGKFFKFGKGNFTARIRQFLDHGAGKPRPGGTVRPT